VQKRVPISGNYPDLEPGNEFWNRVQVPGSCYKSLVSIRCSAQNARKLWHTHAASITHIWHHCACHICKFNFSFVRYWCLWHVV